MLGKLQSWSCRTRPGGESKVDHYQLIHFKDTCRQTSESVQSPIEVHGTIHKCKGTRTCSSVTGLGQCTQHLSGLDLRFGTPGQHFIFGYFKKFHILLFMSYHHWDL